MKPTNEKQFISSKLKEYINLFKAELHQENNILLTPEHCKRILFAYGDGYISSIIPLKVVKKGKLFIYRNYIVSAKATNEVKESAKKFWEPAYVNNTEEVFKIYTGKNDYELLIDCMYMPKSKIDSKVDNCYLEPNIEDIISPETFNTFKDLYSFSKI
jgi:hypothetical protein